MHHFRSLRFRLLALLGLISLSPAYAFALTYNGNAASDYTDAPFSRSETAGISILTEIGAVEGNPDGTFRPGRTLNRAEFLKIALLSKGDTGVNLGDSDNCFPDVRSSVWYSPFVCFAKKQGIVEGNPDGTFRPERAVNYAEAVKMLVTLYGYELPIAKANERWAWYTPYIRAAIDNGVTFSDNLDPSTSLTRGQMARLAAAFVAKDAGELDLYLNFEKGITPPRSSSSSSSSSSMSSSSASSAGSISSSSLSSSSSSIVGSIQTFPARSHLLVLGERSAPIATATFFADLEPVLIRGVEVKLDQREDSIDTMFLIDSTGVELGQLSLNSLSDSSRRTWTGTFTNATYRIPKGEQRTMGIEVRLKGRDSGGATDRHVLVDLFRLEAIGEWSSNTFTSSPQGFTFPTHRTTQARISSAKNALAETGPVPLGTSQVVAAFTITGMHVPGAQLNLETLEFNVSASSVTATNWHIGAEESNDKVPCSVNGTTVTCSSLPASIGSLTSGSSRTVRLFADVTQSGGSPSLQISLNQPGSLTEFGAIRWSDGTASFNWTELDTPVAKGTWWK